MLFALDEVANIGVPALAHKLADSAGYGAFFTIVIHSLAQLRDAYGPDKAASIWSCCGCKMMVRRVLRLHVLRADAPLRSRRAHPAKPATSPSTAGAT